MSKKYQVFISSTYTDLIDERKGVEQTIIRAGDIPVGMEAFPAADEEQFEFIKSVIDQCDYYILIVAGRYGSISDDGLSYTEKEFRYAVKQKIPVLFMLRDEIDKLPSYNTEKDQVGRVKLNDFISLASSGRLRKTWSTIDGLKLLTREALDHSKATKPRPGWVRGDLAASPQLLKEVAELTAERNKLLAEVSSQKPIVIPPSFEKNRDFSISVTAFHMVPSEIVGMVSQPYQSEIKVNSNDLFAFVAPNMRGPLIHQELNRKIAIFALGGKESDIRSSNRVRVDEDNFHDVLLHWEATGLITSEHLKTEKGKNADFSAITTIGTQVMLNARLGLGEA